MQIPESARTVLQSAALGHMVTVDPDGTPHVTVVWVALDGDELITAHMQHRKKVRNMERDPRVAISFETDVLNDRGLNEYLVIHGTARITEGGAGPALQEMAYTYLGPGVKFPPMDEPPPGYIAHITVDRVSGVGPWV